MIIQNKEMLRKILDRIQKKQKDKKKLILFCHHCYEEIIGTFVAKQDGRSFYHPDCFIASEGIEIHDGGK